MPRRMDLWRCGALAQPIERVLAGEPAPVHWLAEQPPGVFLADPFGWPTAAGMRVFVERFDYRTRHGRIECHVLDGAGQLLGSRPVLEEPWHLSYPLVFKGEGETWMLPEACRSGRLTLYRGNAALDHWTAELAIALDRVPIDATPLWHGGRWWLFYSPADTRTTSRSHLHVAWAERLGGPWHPHPLNPVRTDIRSSRPGGRAVVIDGRIMLPTQDCTRTYGGAVRPLWIERLEESQFLARADEPLPLPPGSGRYQDGMHTLSAGGAWTLFDVKRVDRSGRGWWYGLQRWLKPSS